MLAQVCGVLSMAASVCSMQFKKRKMILTALFCLNLFAALNMVFLGSWAAAGVSFFAILEMVVNYLFERKKKPTPNLVVGLYIVGIVAIGVATYEKALDVLAVAGATVFCFTILTKKEQNIRRLMFLNQLLWLVFDVAVGAYALAGSNVLTLISTAVAYARYSKNNKVGKRRRCRSGRKK